MVARARAFQTGGRCMYAGMAFSTRYASDSMADCIVRSTGA